MAYLSEARRIQSFDQGSKSKGKDWNSGESCTRNYNGTVKLLIIFLKISSWIRYLHERLKEKDNEYSRWKLNLLFNLMGYTVLLRDDEKTGKPSRKD